MFDGLPISMRPFNPDTSLELNDFSFILSTWSTELHKVTPVNFIPNIVFFPEQKKIIQNLVNPETTLIAHLDEEPDNIVAYLVFEPFDDSNIIIHWGHTKSIYRRQGVMRAIINSFDIKDKNLICSHYFSLFKKLKDSYHLIYNPNILQGILR